MEVKIKSIGYKDEGLPCILSYLSELKDKNIIVKIDEDCLEGYDFVFNTLKISNLKIQNDKETKYTISTFTCSKTVYKNLLKLIRSIKIFGDGGHSFGIRINKKMFFWDGDGCDRIEEINNIELGSGNCFDKQYSKLIKCMTNEKDKTDIDEVIKRWVKYTIESIITTNTKLVE